jgi:hypothetical protein
MRIQNQEGLLLFKQRLHQQGKDQMLEDIGMIAGMVGVTVAEHKVRLGVAKSNGMANYRLMDSWSPHPALALGGPVAAKGRFDELSWE